MKFLKKNTLVLAIILLCNNDLLNFSKSFSIFFCLLMLFLTFKINNYYCFLTVSKIKDLLIFLAFNYKPHATLVESGNINKTNFVIDIVQEVDVLRMVAEVTTDFISFDNALVFQNICLDKYIFSLK